MIRIEKNKYSIVLNQENGHVLGLYDRTRSESNWIGPQFGIPFINGTQWREENLRTKVERWDNTQILVTSETKATKILYHMGDTELTINLETITDCGPRIGFQMDFNFLDMPGGERFTEQCMPKVIYTDETCSFGYLVFATADKRFCAVVLESPFCAWRIKYDKSGHRMVGFQILTQADDVITDERQLLLTVDRLNLCVLFETSIEACMEAVSKRLKISMVICEVSGGLPGAVIPFNVTAATRCIKIVSPKGAVFIPNENRVRLMETGIYQIITENDFGRKHISRILCHQDWKSMYRKINYFYADYFQDKSGAFYRAIGQKGLTPEGGRTLEGTAFGNIMEPSSCRSGEFGGFAAAAMMKNLLLFGKDEKLKRSVDSYIKNWALNDGHENTPYCGSIFKENSKFLGREYGPYHLYKEVNYPQHEAFLMEQLIDYYWLTKDQKILEDAYKLACHFIEEHMEPDGCVICQNSPETPKVDYCTVHTPIYGLIQVGRALGEGEQSKKLLRYAEKLAEYVYKRGFLFPTEGEPCTEDGSMSCSAATLLYAYIFLEPKPEYLSMAEELLNLHEILELDGTDCRMVGSSTRFWETQYETRDWGPSINAGHAWTVWLAAAKAMLSLVKGEFYTLLRSYEGFLTNICKVEKNGAMTSGYTPDMIPGMPHAPGIWGISDPEDGITEYRMTTTRLGMRYPDRTYSASGNYFLIEAAKIWSHVSGYHGESGVCINGIEKDGRFISGAVVMDCLIIGGNAGRSLVVSCVPAKELTILWENKTQKLNATGGLIKDVQAGRAVVVPNKEEIMITFI